jgi:hypothetical protein
MAGEFVAIIAIICIFGLPIIAGIVLGMKAMKNRNQERMGLINQGIIPPDSSKRKADPNRLVSLRNGILFIALGIGIIVGFICSEYLVIAQGNEFWIIGASVVFFMGVGFLMYFLVSQKIPQSVQKGEFDLD